MTLSAAVPAGRAAAAPFAPATVLYLHEGQNWIRGSERCLLDLIAGLDRTRYTPVVCCNAAALANAAADLGALVHPAPRWEECGNRVLPTRALLREGSGILQRYGARLIHANHPLPLKMFLPAARRAHIPTLVHIHIIPESDERHLSLMHQASLVVGVSRAAVNGLLDDGFPRERAAVIHNGVDRDRLERGDARELRRELGIAPDAIVITALGSLIERKGHDVTLDAFRLLRAHRQDCHLLICGEGPGRVGLEARARGSGIAPWVHFIGERADAGAVLRDATDILASSARQEAFALNLLEAAAFGIPIACSSIPPHREFVSDEENGLLAEPESPASLAAALDRLASDGGLRRRLGDEGRRRVDANFLVSHYVSAFQTRYDELLAAPPRSYGWIGGSRWPRSYTAWARRLLARRLGRSAAGSAP